MTKSILGIAMGLALTSNAFAWGNTDHWERVESKSVQNSGIISPTGGYLQVVCSPTRVAMIRYADNHGVVVESETANTLMFQFDDDDMPRDAIAVSTSNWMGGERNLYNALIALGQGRVVRVWGVDSAGKPITRLTSFSLKGSKGALPDNCMSASEIALGD